MKNKILLTLLVVASALSGWAYDFSAVNADGKTLYYEIIGPDEVALTNGDESYTGDLNIPERVSYHDASYAVTLINGWSTAAGVSSVTLPSTLKRIDGFDIFIGSTFEEVVLPESLVRIDSPNTFRGCINLRKVTINGPLVINNSETFADCPNLTSFEGPYISDDHRCLIVNGILYAFIPRGLYTYQVPDYVTEIGGWAFYGCHDLTHIYLPEGLKKIDNNAFFECSMLENITIPSTVTEIGVSPFLKCDMMEAFYGKFTTEDHTAIINNEDILVAVTRKATNGHYSIPYGTKEIGNRCFTNHHDLTSIDIPNTVTRIGDFAFFGGPPHFDTITIPSSITSIGCCALPGFNCIIAKSKTPHDIGCDWGALSEPENATLYVPRGCKALYEQREPWNRFKEIIELDDVEGEPNVLQADLRVGAPGYSVNVPVRLTNETAAQGLQFDLTLPEGVEVEAVETTDRTARHTVSYNKNNGVYSFVVVSLNSALIDQDHGDVLNITLSIDNAVSCGDYECAFTNVKISDMDNRTVNLPVTGFRIKVSDVNFGDVNCDGDIDVSDITALVNHITHRQVNQFNAQAADVNLDGDIDVADVTTIINYVIHRISTLPYTGASQAPARAPMQATASIAHDNGTYSLGIDSGEYCALQCTVRCAADQEAQIVLGEACTDSHILASNRVAPGEYAVVVFALDNSSFDLSRGPVLDIASASSAMQISGLTLVTPAGVKTGVADLGAAPSGIATISADSIDADAEIYTIMGIKVDPANVDKGIYIINNRKTYVK